MASQDACDVRLILQYRNRRISGTELRFRCFKHDLLCDSRPAIFLQTQELSVRLFGRLKTHLRKRLRKSNEGKSNDGHQRARTVDFPLPKRLPAVLR